MVTLQGWNLPMTRATPVVNTVGDSPFYVHRGVIDSNVLPFQVDTLPECDQRAPNNSIKLAQPTVKRMPHLNKR